MSDFVKFAKYQPGISDNEQNFTVIRSAVGTLDELARERDAERAREPVAVHAGATGPAGAAGPQGRGERNGTGETKDSERLNKREK